MTVSELIEVLRGYDPKMAVAVYRQSDYEVFALDDIHEAQLFRKPGSPYLYHTNYRKEMEPYKVLVIG